MTLDLPIWILFLGTVLVVMIATEAGFRLGRGARRRSEGEKEAPIAEIAGSVLALVAFMLAFTFGLVSDRFDARRSLVRQEANAVRMAYLRTDFLPEADRPEARRLLQEYLDLRLAFAEARAVERLDEFLARTESIQNRLWDMVVAAARPDMDSEIGATYIAALSEIIETHTLRVTIGVQAKIPVQIWIILLGLTILGMMALGYRLGIAGSTRSLASLILAVAFATVIALIVALDRPTGFIRITQQPLIDVRTAIHAAERASGQR